MTELSIVRSINPAFLSIRNPAFPLAACKKPPAHNRAGGDRLSIKPRRVRCVSSEKNPNHFLPGRVPGRKYISGCKCGICSPMANKLCAQQTAKTGGKARRGFSTSSNPLHTTVQGVKLYVLMPQGGREISEAGRQSGTGRSRRSRKPSRSSGGGPVHR